MENSGAILKEVGSTNRVYKNDYINALSENSGALIKVHTSNYRVKGFTHAVSSKELAEIAHNYQLPLIEDLGSGVLFDLSNYGLPYEPTVKEEIKAGIDVITFSGDKLLGGPQAGIIAGKEKYISQIESHPLMRALRVDKMTLAALEETLKLYYNFETAVKKIPTLNLITEKSKTVKKRALNLQSKINSRDELNIELIKTAAKIGGGAYPLNNFDSFGLHFSFEYISTEDFVSRLRKLKTPVIARIKSDKAIFDLKTVKDEEIELLADSINKVIAEVF
jgi:L-seryl-tRNA(Ser) seleniumtransferase